MKPHEIASAKVDATHGDEWLSLLTAQNRWLREIAYQFAVFNDMLSSDVRLDIHIHHHDDIEQHDYRQLAKEIIKAMKEMTDEAKQAILDSLATLGDDIINAATAAAKKETDEIIKFVSKLQTQNGPITREDVGSILDMIKGVAPNVGTGVAASIDAISKGAGADDAGTGDGGGTPTPTPEPGPTP